MTNVDEIRKRHDPTCAGRCDVGALLAALDSLQIDFERSEDENARMWEERATLIHLSEQYRDMVRSLRQQRTYLAGRLSDLVGRPYNRQNDAIMSLRRKLRHVREQLDLQVEATRRQQMRKAQLSAANHSMQANLAQVAKRAWSAEANSVTIRGALLRARDELEAATGECQPWIDAAIMGQEGPTPSMIERAVSIAKPATAVREQPCSSCGLMPAQHVLGECRQVPAICPRCFAPYHGPRIKRSDCEQAHAQRVGG